MALQKATLKIQKFKPLQLYKIWRETLGEALTQFVEFQGVYTSPQGPVVKVFIKDPLWRQEIHHQGPQILERFQKALKTAGFESKDIPVRIETSTKKTT